MNHLDEVRKQFNIQAANFSQHPTIANSNYEQWMLDHIRLNSDDKVLDVAAGTGSFSRAIAPYVKVVTALDFTPAMLEQGRLETPKMGLTNIQFEQGIAENLPYSDSFFDVVVTRFSLHHLQVPINALYEMWRVLKAGGQIAVIDLVSPEELELASTYNQLERLRDPSHTTAYSASALLDMVAQVGLDRVEKAERDIEVDLTTWLNLTQTPSEVRTVIQNRIEAEQNGGKRTGMRPFKHAEQQKFLQRWMIVTGVKK